MIRTILNPNHWKSKQNGCHFVPIYNGFRKHDRHSVQNKMPLENWTEGYQWNTRPRFGWQTSRIKSGFKDCFVQSDKKHKPSGGTTNIQFLGRLEIRGARNWFWKLDWIDSGKHFFIKSITTKLRTNLFLHFQSLFLRSFFSFVPLCGLEQGQSFRLQVRQDLVIRVQEQALVAPLGAFGRPLKL